MVRAALSGALDTIETITDPVFQLAVPTSCPNVPATQLNPRNLWADKHAYDVAAQQLAQRFIDNFKQFSGVDALIAVGPQV
jgi:phosphoenolpyruvate carboxykinase (ATP)